MSNTRLTFFAMLFVACLVTANIIAVKVLALPFGFIVPAGILVFPLSYAVNDLVSELAGFAIMRSLILFGFGCNLAMVGAIELAIVLPGAAFWQQQAAFYSILGFTPRLLVASFTAYLVGQFVNSFVFVRMKGATHDHYLWLRAISSTAVGEALDTIIFILIAFSGVIPQSLLLSAILVQWAIKVAYEAAALPLTYAAVRGLRSRS